MDYDSIPFDRMSPDTSTYEKGLRLVENAVPVEQGAYRELNVPRLSASLLMGGLTITGVFTDPLGVIFVATGSFTAPFTFTSRIYVYDPLAFTFTNVTPGTDYTGLPTRFSFTKFGAAVIATPIQDPLSGTAIQMQVRNSGAGNFANLVTSADRPAPKYVCASKAYVVGANNQASGAAGIYATTDPYQVMWCARNDATIWTPGVDRAGFAPSLSAERGKITGTVGFTEFFVVFQEFGVTRFTWTGGDNVWESQEIAGAAFGLPGELSPSVIALHRDILYISQSGPAMIRNGEVAQLDDAAIARFLREDASYSILRGGSGLVQGALEDRLGVALWTASNGGVFFQLCRGSDGRMTVLDGCPQSAGVGVSRLGTSNYPLERMVFFDMQSGTLSARQLTVSSPRVTQTMRFTTKRWRPATGVRCHIRAVRPLAIANPTGAVPPLTVAVTAAARPTFQATVAATVTNVAASSVDDNGWLTDAAFPMEGNEFAFVASVGNLGSNTLQEFPALELAFTAKSVF